MALLQTAVQTPNPGAYVALFAIDTSSIGGPQIFFTNSTNKNGSTIKFGGVEYQPADIEFSGFEISGSGSLPTPTMKVANTDGIMQDIVNTYGDLLGCPVARVRTFAQFLDGGTEADPGKYFGPDIFRVEQKVDENDTFIEWQLSASIDQEGKQLPGRIVVKDVCPWRYRHWDSDAEDWIYPAGSNACPYAGSDRFTMLDVATSDNAKDSCSHTIAGCKARFGVGAPLPFGGFLGVGRT